MRNYSKPTLNLIAMVLKKLEDENFGFVNVDDERGSVTFITNHLIYRFACVFYIVNDQGDFFVTILCYVDESEDDDNTNYQKVQVDLRNETQVKEMATYLCYLNDDIYFGNFNLNREDGTIAFRWGIKCNGELPSINDITYCVSKPLEIFEKYEMRMSLIINDDFTAEEAYEEDY